MLYKHSLFTTQGFLHKALIILVSSRDSVAIRVVTIFPREIIKYYRMLILHLERGHCKFLQTRTSHSTAIPGEINETPRLQCLHENTPQWCHALSTRCSKAFIPSAIYFFPYFNQSVLVYVLPAFNGSYLVLFYFLLIHVVLNPFYYLLFMYSSKFSCFVSFICLYVSVLCV